MTSSNDDALRFALGTVIRRSEGTATSDLGTEVVVLEPEAGHYFGLEEVGALIWNLLEDGSTVAEIEAVVMDEYQVSVERCREDIQQLLTELAARGLIRTGSG